MKSFRKKIVFTCLLFSIVGIAFSSCSSDDDIQEYLDIDLEEDVLLVDGSTFKDTIQVKSSSDWMVYSALDEAWLTFVKNNEYLVLSYMPNSSGVKRVGQLALVNEQGLSKILTVDQAPGDEVKFELSGESENWVNYHDTFYEFTVKSSSNWDYEARDCDWITFEKNEGSSDTDALILSFKENFNKVKREAKIYFKSGSSLKEVSIIQRGKKDFEDVTHKFYFHFGSFPVLYSALDLAQHNLPSYLYDARVNIDPTKVGSNVNVVQYNQFPDYYISEIDRINKENPDAVFEYISEDIRSTYAIPIFTQLGIDSSRVKITMCPDGTAAYTSIYTSNFGDKTEGEVIYKKALQEFKEYYQKFIDDPSKGKEITSNNTNKFANFIYPHIFAREGQCRYYIENKDYLISENSYVKAQVEHTNYIVDTPLQILKSLNENQRSQFLEMVGFNPDIYHKQFNESPKPNLIILGTNTNAGWTSPAQQAGYVQKIMDRYGSEYDVFYKAHPSDSAYKEYEKMFPGLRLILPARLPFEVFTWALDDDIDMIGGFSTSTFLTMPTEKIKFMFAKDVTQLSLLFQQILSNRDDIYWVTLD